MNMKAVRVGAWVLDEEVDRCVAVLNDRSEVERVLYAENPELFSCLEGQRIDEDGIIDHGIEYAPWH